MNYLKNALIKAFVEGLRSACRVTLNTMCFNAARCIVYMGCGVFKQGIQNSKDFCIKINIPKGNY